MDGGDIWSVSIATEGFYMLFTKILMGQTHTFSSTVSYCFHLMDLLLCSLLLFINIAKGAHKRNITAASRNYMYVHV
jgi:hypothetical protein